MRKSKYTELSRGEIEERLVNDKNHDDPVVDELMRLIESYCEVAGPAEEPIEVIAASYADQIKARK